MSQQYHPSPPPYGAVPPANPFAPATAVHPGSTASSTLAPRRTGVAAIGLVLALVALALLAYVYLDAIPAIQRLRTAGVYSSLRGSGMDTYWAVRRKFGEIGQVTIAASAGASLSLVLGLVGRRAGAVAAVALVAASLALMVSLSVWAQYGSRMIQGL